MIKKSAIVDNATVDAQDARVKKMMKLETWFSEGSLEPFEDWLELNSNRQLLFNKLTVCSIAGGRSREDDWVRRLTIGEYPVS